MKKMQYIRKLWFSSSAKPINLIKRLRFCGEGFAEDAFILTRTLFEIALQEGYMKLDPKPRARLFTEYDPVMRYRFYQKLKKLPDANMLQAIGSRAHDLLVLKQQHDRLKTKYPEGKSWLGEPIAWLARQLGKGAEAEYMSV